MKLKQRPDSSHTQKGEEKSLLLRKKRHRRLFFIKIIVLIVLFTFIGSAYAEAPAIRSFVARVTTPKPKPLVSSTTKLSPTTQQAIKTLAEQEIRDAKAESLVATSTSTSESGVTAAGDMASTTDGAAKAQDTTPENPGLIQSIRETIQGAVTSDPVARATIRLRKIDGLIAELQELLANDKSDTAITKAVALIQEIGQKTGEVATDPAVQTDRDILKLQIEQYNRLQLILQRVEDQLPAQGYLKIEEARLMYLVRGAQESINAAPNLDALHNIARKEVATIVGEDFADLKVIEILTDIGSGLKPEAKEKLEGLQKQVARDFEKRMLKVAPHVRNRKLQDYIAFSHGNPLRQAEAFEHMKDFLTDRDLILGVESLKELSLKRLEERVFSIVDQDTLNQFLDASFRTPDQLKVLVQMKLDVLGGQDEGRKQRLAELEANAQDKVVATFGTKEKLEAYFAQAEHQHGDILDAISVIQLADTLNKSPRVEAAAKTVIQDIKRQTLQAFVASIRQSGFTTVAKVGYSPVGEAADVRLLLPAPQTLTLLATIRNELADKDKAAMTTVERATSTLVAEHLLSQVDNVDIFEQYQTFITTTPQAKQLLQSHVGGRVLGTIAKKEKVVVVEAKVQEQALYEKMQQVTQRVFASNSKTNLERQFSTEVQQEIASLKADLPTHNIPQLEIPAGVKLSEVAVLPGEVQEAIIQAAKNRIKQGNQPEKLATELAKQAKDLGVSVPAVLPGNPLYAIKKATRLISLAVRTNPINQAQELLKQDNAKTIEAAQLLIDNPSQKSIELALETLESVAKDFATIKENTSKLTDVGSNQTAQIDVLVDQMIDNGLSRQAVISLIENQVHGDAYVAVEEIRSNLLKDGVDILLKVTNGDVEKLTENLQETVTNETSNQLEGIKAVELLNEIARSQPENIQTILQTTETGIATKVEETLLAMPEEQRVETVLNYAEDQTGNPVRQFEAYEILENTFTNPDTILLAEGLKDQVTANLEERISEIPDANTQQEFIDTVIGSEPQDLKVITEIELRVQAPVETAVIEETPIQTQIAEIKSNIEQEIIDAYKDNPEGLKQADFFDNPNLVQQPDVVDVEVARELTEVLERSPDVQPEVVEVAQEESQHIITTFIANATETSAEVVAQTLSPIPETLALLVELKSEVSVAQQANIGIAINAQVDLMQQYLTTEVPDPQTFQTYVIQITENPEVAQAVAAAGGTDFIQAIEAKAQEIQTTATEDQTSLQTVVDQIEHEIFSAPVGAASTTEQALSPAIQEEIQEIKHEVPVEQIPTVTVPAEVTTTPTAIETIQATPEPIVPLSTTTPIQSTAPTIQEPAPVQAPAAPAPAPLGL